MNGNWTIEYFFKRKDTGDVYGNEVSGGANQSVGSVNGYLSSSDPVFYCMEYSNRRIGIGGHYLSTYYISSSLPENEYFDTWHHYVIQKGGNIEIYYDGIRVTINSHIPQGWNPIQATASLCSIPGYWNEFRISNITRYPNGAGLPIPTINIDTDSILKVY